MLSSLILAAALGLPPAPAAVRADPRCSCKCGGPCICGWFCDCKPPAECPCGPGCDCGPGCACGTKARPKNAVATPAPSSNDGQLSAEGRACDYWSRRYRGGLKFGAAWRDDLDGVPLCWVGICDGRTDAPGYHREVVAGGGGYYNLSWDAKHRAPGGGYYKSAEWFGKGRTWDEAFYDASCHGFCPLGPDGGYDHAEFCRVCGRVGKPVYRTPDGSPVKGGPDGVALTALLGLVAADPPHAHAPPKGKAGGDGTAGPVVKLPATLEVASGDWVVLTAETDARAVKFVVLDPAGFKRFPPQLVTDPKTLVATAPDGTYRVLAYTGTADGPSDPVVCVVTVGKPGPQPPPPNDPLFLAVQAAYTADPAPDKAKALGALRLFWSQVSANVLSPSYGANAGDLFARLTADRQAAFAGLGVNTESLPGVRTAAHAGLSSIFPAQPAAAITPDQRTQAAALFTKLAALAPQVK